VRKEGARGGEKGGKIGVFKQKGGYIARKRGGDQQGALGSAFLPCPHRDRRATKGDKRKTEENEGEEALGEEGADQSQWRNGARLYP